MSHWPRLLVFVACFTALVVSAAAQQGRVLEGRTFHSDVLDREWAYTIYLPSGYDSSERAYPVFYLLHGLGGNHTGFVRSGSADMIAVSLIAAAEIPPVILVMPDGSRSFWLDSDPVTGVQRHQAGHVRVEGVPAEGPSVSSRALLLFLGAREAAWLARDG